jgi:hypothetical protein
MTPYELVRRAMQMGRLGLEAIENVGPLFRTADGQAVRGPEHLIDHITITTFPVFLGDGIPLFAPMGKEIRLTPMRTRVFDFGFVQTTYSVRSRA